MADARVSERPDAGADAPAEGLELVRDLKAIPDAVFDAWTTPERFAAWFGGDQATVPLDRLDYRPVAGSTWSAVMVLPDGAELTWAGEFVEVRRPDRIVMTLTDDPTNSARELLSATFTGSPDGTTMRVSQTGGHLTPEQYEQARAGYGSFFDVLERLLAA